MESYDEDLTQNGWYISLFQKHEDLYARATNERWMICIPQQGTWKPGFDDGDLFSQKYFESHMLKPVVVYSSENSNVESTHQTNFVTFNGKEVHIEGSKINCGSGFSNKFQKPSYDTRSETLDLQVESCHSSEILFEETFFNQNDESYIVLCISQPLEPDLVLQKKRNDIEDDETQANKEATSVWETYGSFIWSKASNGTRCRNLVNDKVNLFISDQKNAPYSYTLMGKNEQAAAKEIKSTSDKAVDLLTTCFNLLHKDLKLRKYCEQPAQYEEFRTALENYVQHDIHDVVMNKLNDLLSFKDCFLNKITRSLSSIRLADLGIQERFSAGLPRARREFSKLNHYSTPKQKLCCLQKALMFISEESVNANNLAGVQKGSAGLETKPQDSVAMSSDDLLPTLIYLVLKCDVANWLANLQYLKYFQFTATAGDKLGFYLATLEAAIEHVKNDNIDLDNVKVLPLKRQNSSENVEQLLRLFMLIRDGDTSGVRRFLRQAEALRDLHEHDKCHPLCECQKCSKLTQGPGKKGAKAGVSVTTRDDRGRCALHAAALSGKHEVVDVLVEFDADLNATDYHGCTPLHLAAQEGSQSVIFLLLHHGANPSAEDNNNNTPLHLACLGGHEGCVKALLYFDPTADIVKVNAINDLGDSPLHLASKWGYVKIAQALVEYNADVTLKNRRKLTPLDVSHNSDVTAVIKASGTETNTISRYIEPKRKKSSFRKSTLSKNTGLANEGTAKLKSDRQNCDDPKNTTKQVEKLLRAISDNDANMLCYLCGWAVTPGTATPAKCHPLCQCTKCKPPLSDPVLHANVTGPDGQTPLSLASKLGHIEVVGLLLRHNAKPDAKLRNNGHTALHLACQYGHVKVIEYLLRHGAYCDIRDNEGNTPIFMSAMNGHTSCIAVLAQHGASVNIRNRKGDSPLHEAVKWRHSDTVRLLDDLGAVAYYKNNLGKTPVELSATDPELQEILISHASGVHDANSSSHAKIAHVESAPTNQDSTRKSISQSEADEALADQLLDKFHNQAPSTPPIYDSASARSIKLDFDPTKIDDLTRSDDVINRDVTEKGALLEGASFEVTAPVAPNDMLKIEPDAASDCECKSLVTSECNFESSDSAEDCSKTIDGALANSEICESPSVEQTLMPGVPNCDRVLDTATNVVSTNVDINCEFTDDTPCFSGDLTTNYVTGELKPLSFPVANKHVTDSSHAVTTHTLDSSTTTSNSNSYFEIASKSTSDVVVFVTSEVTPGSDSLTEKCRTPSSGEGAYLCLNNEGEKSDTKLE